MAKVHLRLSDSEFWDMAPRAFFCVISEYMEIRNYDLSLSAYVKSGGKLEQVYKPHRGDEVEELVDADWF